MRRSKGLINLIVILVCILCISACGTEPTQTVSETAQTVSEPELAISEEEQQVVIEEEKPVVELTQTEVEADEPEERILHFVDVFGEEYETPILEDVPPIDYDCNLFSQDGEKKIYKEDPRYSTKLGIDVSYHQGKINWDKVAADGYEFVIIRVAYRGYGKGGSLQKDKLFDSYISGAQASGLDVGVYIFSQAINEDEAIEEAEYVLKCIDGYELQLPIVYDPESILDAPARTDGVSGEQFTANTLAFCDRIKQAGYEPMIYSNMLWEAFEFDMSQTSIYPYWYADYEMLPQTPYDFEIWQYTNTGHVDGVSTEVDIDIMFIPN